MSFAILAISFIVFLMLAVPIWAAMLVSAFLAILYSGFPLAIVAERSLSCLLYTSRCV